MLTLTRVLLGQILWLPTSNILPAASLIVKYCFLVNFHYQAACKTFELNFFLENFKTSLWSVKCTVYLLKFKTFKYIINIHLNT